MSSTHRRKLDENSLLRLSYFCLLIFFLCTGCVPVADRSPVAIDMPQQFSASGETTPESRWWLDFHDEALETLVNQALSDNFSLQATKEKITAAAAVRTQTSSALFPTLDGEAAVSTSRDYQTNTTTDSFYAGLVAGYEIDLWNRLGSLADASELDLQATAADYEAAVISLSAQVATVWYQLTEMRLQEELLNSQRETNRKILALIDIQFRSGQVPITDVLQQQQLIETNSGDLAALKAEIRTLQNQLAILLGVVPTSFSPPRLTTLPTLPPLPATGIPADILINRPDLQTAFLQLQAADKRVSAAIANRFPRLAITGELTSSASRASDLFDNWFTTLAGNLFGPIFDAGARKGVVREQEAIARQLFLAYQQLTLEAVLEVENSLVQEQQKLEVVSSLKRRLELATETVSRLSVRYRQGAADYQEVLLALRSKQGLEQSILTSNRQLLEYRIGLYRALSGRIPPKEVPDKTIETTSLGASTATTSSGDHIE